MKKLPFYLMFLVLLSCGGEGDEANKDSGTVLENFSYTVDTVIVDPGEEIINLSRGLGAAAASADRKYLYQLDITNSLINKINLDELVLEAQLPVEKEGPNGIGEYIFSMQMMDDGNVFLGGFNSSGLFNLQGEKVKDLNLNPEEIEGLEELDSFAFSSGLKPTKDGRYAFALPSDFLEGERDFAVIDLEKESGIMRRIPAMDKALEYSIIMRDGDMIQGAGESVTVNVIEDLVLISNSASNKMYRYDIEEDSLYLLEYNFSLVPNEKDKPINNEVSSMSDFEVEREKAEMQIYFGNLLYDQDNKQIYRFGRIWGPKVEEGQTREGEFFMFVFDEELNLIGETKIEGITNIPYSAIFKDGKLWSYVNVEDELGFAVFDFKF